MHQSDNRKREPRPIPVSWALEIILQLDTARPGFLNFLHSASSLRRQGVFLAISQWDESAVDHMAASISQHPQSQNDSETDPYASIACALTHMRVRDIVQVVFGSTPHGIVGALSRCGDDPLDAFNYAVLLSICSAPNDRARANLFRHAREIDDDLVQVVWRLPPALLRPEVLNQIRTPEQIDQFMPALNLVKRLHALTDEDLALSFSQMPRGSDLSQWVMRWLERAECLATKLPHPGNDLLRPIVSASEMRDVARRYRNCLRNRIAPVALGRVVYYEFTGSPGAVAELAALSNGRWLLERIYGPNNTRPRREAVRVIRQTLEAAGVLVAVAHHQDRGLRQVAGMLHLYDFSAEIGLIRRLMRRLEACAGSRRGLCSRILDRQ